MERARLTERVVQTAEIARFHELLEDTDFSFRFARYLAVRELEMDPNIDEADPIGIGMLAIQNFFRFKDQIDYLTEVTKERESNELQALRHDPNLADWLEVCGRFEDSLWNEGHNGVSMLRGSDFIDSLRADLRRGE